MSNTSATNHTRPGHKPRPMVDLLVSIIIPSLILMKLSGDENLGATTALIVALAFPLGWVCLSWLNIKNLTSSRCWD